MNKVLSFIGELFSLILGIFIFYAVTTGIFYIICQGFNIRFGFDLSMGVAASFILLMFMKNFYDNYFHIKKVEEKVDEDE